jgi:hypothetical protein
MPRMRWHFLARWRSRKARSPLFPLASGQRRSAASPLAVSWIHASLGALEPGGGGFGGIGLIVLIIVLVLLFGGGRIW